jgi:hypothetical protein
MATPFQRFNRKKGKEIGRVTTHCIEKRNGYPGGPGKGRQAGGSFRDLVMVGKSGWKWHVIGYQIFFILEILFIAWILYELWILYIVPDKMDWWEKGSQIITK